MPLLQDFQKGGEQTFVWTTSPTEKGPTPPVEDRADTIIAQTNYRQQPYVTAAAVAEGEREQNDSCQEYTIIT